MTNEMTNVTTENVSPTLKKITNKEYAKLYFSLVVICSLVIAGMPQDKTDDPSAIKKSYCPQKSLFGNKAGDKELLSNDDTSLILYSLYI